MRRTEAERRRRAKNRAQRAKQRVLFLQGSKIVQGCVVPGHEQMFPEPTVGAKWFEVRPRGWTTGIPGVLTPAGEGRTWVHGWFGEVPDAFRARVALLAGTPA